MSLEADLEKELADLDDRLRGKLEHVDLVNQLAAEIAFSESRRSYDVSPDGERVLMIEEGGGTGEASRPELILVLNWTEELKRLVPRNQERGSR